MTIFNNIEPKDMIYCKESVTNIFGNFLFIKGEKCLIRHIDPYYLDIYVFSNCIHSTVKIKRNVFETCFDVKKLVREKKLKKINYDKI